MSRNFVRASSQYLEHAAAVVSAMPLTLACWGKIASLTAGQIHTLVSISTDTGNIRDGYFIEVIEAGNGDALRAQAGSGIGSAGVASKAFSAGGAPIATWFHAAAVFASTTSRTIYLDGSSVANATNITAAAGLNRTSLGRKANYLNAATHYWDGDIAHAAIWNIALSGANITSLAAGANPLAIEAANLVAYWPLAGAASPEPDDQASYDMTITGATAGADDPTVDGPPSAFNGPTILRRMPHGGREPLFWTQW